MNMHGDTLKVVQIEWGCAHLRFFRPEIYLLKGLSLLHSHFCVSLLLLSVVLIQIQRLAGRKTRVEAHFRDSSSSEK